MSHEIPATPESAPEHIPSLEEVLSVMKKLTEKEPTETRRREDEKGLYLLDVTVPGEKAGELIEYSYMRKGTYPEGAADPTRIDATYYEDDMPMGGKSVAKCVDGSWEML